MTGLNTKLWVVCASATFTVSMLTLRQALEYSSADVERSCLTLSDFMEDPSAYKAEVSYPSLMAVFNLESLGREMLDYVADTDPDLQICDMELPSDTLAIYNGKQIGVDYDRRSDMTSLIIKIVHEMTHHYQAQNGVVYPDIRRSLVDNQRVLLATESAAFVMPWLTLFEAGLGGSFDWRTNLEPESDTYTIMDIFTTLHQSLIREGHSEAQALNDIAKMLWIGNFTDQDILDGYNNRVVKFVLMSADRLKPDYYNYQDDSVEQGIIQAGKIGDDLHFSSLEDMPPNDALFGKNQEMREIFEAVEWYRSSHMLGEDHAAVIVEKTHLQIFGNRFVDVDFDDVTDKIRQGMDVETAFKEAISEPADPAVSMLSPAAAFKDNAVRSALQNWTAESPLDRSSTPRRRKPGLAA